MCGVIGAVSSAQGASADSTSALAGQAEAVLTTFGAEADTRVHEAAPTANYGARAVLRVDGATDPDIESYLRFPVTGLAGTVTRATLRLHAITDTSDGPRVSGTSNDWSETTLTWNGRPAPTTAPVADAGAIAVGAWMELDVTQLVSGNGTVSFVLTATSTDGVDFDSRESTTATFRPELVVEALTSSAPVPVSPPLTSGVAQEGQTLTGSLGTWNGSQPMTFAKQWQRCDAAGEGCVDVPDEVGDTFTLTQSDVGTRIRLVVTATNVDGSATASSAPTSAIIGAGDIVVAAAGDIAGCTWNTDEATAQLLDAIDPAYVLTLGDNAYESGTDAEFANCYEPTWGRHKAKTRPSPGNHEYNTPGATGYYAYFGSAAGDPARGYYAFDLGPWRLYSLNTNCSSVPCGAGSEQEQWLRADLAANPRSCVAAFMHYPRFSSGSSHGSNPVVGALWTALYDHGADLVLAGHDHSYERFARLTPAGTIDTTSGVRSFVVGTGGAGLYPFGAPLTGSEARSATHGVLRLVLRDTGYDWQFVAVPGSTFTDAGSETCDASPEDTTPPTAPSSLASTSPVAGNVGLTWAGSTDEVGVVGYDVFRDAQLLARATSTTYADTSAAAGETHDYHVVAVDAAGNPSPPSNTVTVEVQPPPSGTLTFGADADARVVETKPTSNYGKAAQLRVVGGTDPDIESYLRFVVSGVQGSVQSAVLRVYAYTATVDGPAAYGTSSGWTELGITWATRPAPTTGALDDEPAIPGNVWVEYDVTPFVTGNGSFSFVLASTSRDSVDFYSRNSTQATLRPQLVVTFG